MRILTGDCKYKKISYIKNDKLRPTRNIVRKSFFDTIGQRVKGSIFLDLFAGAGTIGLEAASRGAKEVIFVDKSFQSIETIKKNVDYMRCSSSIIIIRAGADESINSHKMKTSDIAYIDAPYTFDVNIFLKEFFRNVNKNAIVCVEHLRGRNLNDIFGGFKKIKSKTFGKNSLDYFKAENE